jgi:hypothetical protein
MLKPWLEFNMSGLFRQQSRFIGRAILEFRLQEPNIGNCSLQLTARFWPRGLFGLLYWWMVTLLHGYVFRGLLRGIGQSLGKDILQPPDPVKSRLE